MEKEFNTEIAIIGMAGRFPGAADLRQFWHNLRNGVESVSFFSDEEVAEAQVPIALSSDANYVKARAILDDIKLFDAHFFDINPREAEILDVQQRLFLETAWQALEQAGYSSDIGAEIIGVYAGSGWNSYLFNNLASNRALIDTVGGYQVMISNDKDFLATRVAYKLDLKGPAVAVQTACSTSLVAIHLACQSLLNGECDVALAGGVSVSLPQRQGYLYQPGMILSVDGHCRAFDENASGTIGGDGVGVVVLKPLEDALEDGDFIHAVIKGSAINNDGGVKAGYTAPSETGQAAVIQEALAVAGLSPSDISYIEAHGTGTHLGDPIELAALHSVFGSASEKWCRIGSVKTNIGHLDAAAGVAGVIKTVLALTNKEIPATLHFQKINPEIDFGKMPFVINNSLTSWEREDAPRRAGVSSFGIGGTNAHLILEEAVQISRVLPEGKIPVLLTLSAKTKDALDRMIVNLENHLEKNPEQHLTDVAFTLNQGRKLFPHRHFSIISARENLPLDRLIPQFKATNHSVAAIGFLFSGQGAQYLGMGANLYQHEPVFRQWFDKCDQITLPLLGISLFELVFAKEKNQFSKDRLQQTQYTQPALFAVEYALAQLWLSWGVRPAVMMGHSLGEYVAACLANVFSLEDGLSLVVARGKLMQSVAPGKMMAVMAPVKEIEPFLLSGVSIAAVNSEISTVVSGSFAEINRLEEVLAGIDISCIPLRTSHAFHSTMMQSIVDSFLQQVDKISLSPPTIPFVSNVTALLIRNEEATSAAYWAKHLRNTVLFADGLTTLFQMDIDCLLEIGPGSSLRQLAEQHAQLGDCFVLNSIPKAAARNDDYETILESLGHLWQKGVTIDWFAFHNKRKQGRIPLPTYPFQKTEYWIDPASHEVNEKSKELKSRSLNEWGYIPSWSRKPIFKERFVKEMAEQNWLLFMDEMGVTERLSAQLRERGESVYSVFRGEQLDIGAKKATIPFAASEKDYRQLFDWLEENGRLPNQIVYSWLLSSEIRTLSENSELGLQIPIQLMQGWGERKDALSIRFLTNNSMELAGESYLNFGQNVVLGPLRVIPLEYINVHCSLIDFLLNDLDQIVVALLYELFWGNDEIVVYRNQQRWVEKYEQIPIIIDEGKSSLRQNGVYLITGGLGGIGLTLAEYLMEKVNGRLILTSRTGLPDESEWDRLLESSLDKSLIKKIEAIKNLKKKGSLLIKAVDVSDAQGMERLVTDIRNQFGNINGIIHAAGIPGGGIIQLRQKEKVAELLKAKVTGTVLLADLMVTQHDFDFMLVCSSISSILGSFGQVAYCAANAFVDGFARQAFREGKNIVAVNWDSWEEVGMAVQAGFDGSGISPEEGKLLFELAVRLRQPQMIFSTFDLDARKKGMKKAIVMPVEPQDMAIENRYPRPSIEIDYVAPENEVEQIIASFYSFLLGIEPIGRMDDFFILGGHSLLAIRLLSRLKENFDFAPSLADFFENPTVAYLSEQILLTQIDEMDDFEAMLDEIENE